MKILKWFLLFSLLISFTSVYALDPGYIWMKKDGWVQFKANSNVTIKIFSSDKSAKIEVKRGSDSNNLSYFGEITVQKNNYANSVFTGGLYYNLKVKDGSYVCVYLPNSLREITWKEIIKRVPGKIERAWRLPDDAWKEYSNNVANKRKEILNKIYTLLIHDIPSINETQVALKTGLGSLLNGVGQAYFENKAGLDFLADCFVDAGSEVLSLWAQTKSTVYSAVYGTLAEVYSGAFMALEYAKWSRDILWEVVPSAINDMQQAVQIIQSFKSLVGSFRTDFLSKISELISNIDSEQNARNSSNKDLLKISLRNQRNIIFDKTALNNPNYRSTSDFNTSGLSLWHIAGKFYALSKERENNSNYPSSERKAYTLLKYLTKKLQVILTDLYINTSWIEQLEYESYTLKDYSYQF